MAHFAELDSNNVVKRVIVVSDQDTSDQTGVEKEAIGVAFCKSLFGEHTIWKQTSYNAKFRKRYAGKGMTYREDLDAFIPQQPFPSWSLNEQDAKWEPPVLPAELTQEQIDNGEYYYWDENTYNESGNGWILFTPPVPSLPPEEEPVT